MTNENIDDPITTSVLHMGNITISTQCILCGQPIELPALNSNYVGVCDECKRKWQKLTKMVDVIEDLATNEDN